MMKNIIEKFQICLVLSALLFSSFVAACSGNDDTVTPEINDSREHSDGWNDFLQDRRNKYAEHQVERCIGSYQQCTGVV